MAGLLKSWCYALISMFVMYSMFGLLTPVLSLIETAIFTEQTMLMMNEYWLQVYMEWAPILRDFFGFVSIALYIGLIVYIVLSAATIEPNEVRY